MIKLRILRFKESDRKSAKTKLQLSLPSLKTKKKESDSASSNVAVTRAGVKKESYAILSMFSPAVPKSKRMMESESGKGERFRVVLIEEGLGNLRDGFFYTKKALQKGPQIFEGKPCYANHPSRTEQDERPERDVRDMIGHFEEVEYVENAGQGSLEANLCIMPGESYSWVSEMIEHDLEYKKKFPDKQFVGLSINAMGQSEEEEMQKVLGSVESEEIRKKLEQALENGITTVKMVTELTDAVSCDLVTKAGAGGKILGPA